MIFQTTTPTITPIIEVVDSLVTAAIGWIGQFVTVIVDNPLLLMFVVTAFVGPWRLQADDTLDQTNAETDEGSDNEHQQQGVGNDDSDKITDPTDTRSNERRDYRNDTFHV